MNMALGAISADRVGIAVFNEADRADDHRLGDIRARHRRFGLAQQQAALLGTSH